MSATVWYPSDDGPLARAALDVHLLLDRCEG